MEKYENQGGSNFDETGFIHDLDYLYNATNLSDDFNDNDFSSNSNSK